MSIFAKNLIEQKYNTNNYIIINRNKPETWNIVCVDIKTKPFHTDIR
jgi:hypothetical protein